jgi:hypothetical protein
MHTRSEVFHSFLSTKQYERTTRIAEQIDVCEKYEQQQLLLLCQVWILLWLPVSFRITHEVKDNIIGISLVGDSLLAHAGFIYSWLSTKQLLLLLCVICCTLIVIFCMSCKGGWYNNIGISLMMDPFLGACWFYLFLLTNQQYGTNNNNCWQWVRIGCVLLANLFFL